MNNFPKFKIGDRVQTIYGVKGEVVGFKSTEKSFIVSIHTNSGTHRYAQEDLKFDSEYLEEGISYDIKDRCPKCSSEWTVTRFGAKTWKDCPKCNKTAEELCKTYNSSPKHMSRKDEPVYGYDFATADLGDDDEGLSLDDWTDLLDYMNKP